MRCKACDYPLWNLTARVCPECGRPFAPSQFDFIANSVRFCCPHCQQDYYGTGPRGHLEPVEFDCARCHQHIAMDQMVLLPAEGVKEEQTEVDQVPWLVRAKIGRFKAIFRTIGRAMFEPGRLARATPDPGGVGAAWLFCFFANLGYLIFGAAPLMIFPFIAILGGPARGPAPGMAMFLTVLIMILVGLALIAVLFPLWGLCSHAILHFTGPTRLGPGASVRTLCYASGTNACAGIPCVGFYLAIPGLIWTGISAAFQLRIVHRVGWLRAFLAGLLPPAAAVGALAALIDFVLVPIMSSASSSSARWTARPGSAATLSVALSAYRARHNDQFPSHAIELMHEGDLVASGLTTLNFGAAPDQSDSVLTSFQILDGKQRTAVVTRLIATMPKDVIAHRLGDVVFTYHGIDPANGDPKLWVAVEMPESTSAAPAAPVQTYRFPAAGDSVGVVQLDGATLRIPRTSFAGRLAAQNRVRAQASLPPLPDPSTVRAGIPATAPPPQPPP